MFRNIEQLYAYGLSRATRVDIAYVIGAVYDDIVANDGIISTEIEKKMEAARIYLHDHLWITGQRTRKIAKIPTIIIRMQEDFGFVKEKEVKIIQQKKVKTPLEHKGIYGIYVDNNLVYIGSTVCFKDRFAAHRKNLKNECDNMYLYQELVKYIKMGNYQITFKVLIDLDDCGENHKFTDAEMRAMEYALIKQLQPAYNIAGKIIPFYYIKN